MTDVTHVTDETFGQKVLESEEPVLVNFTASWCGPCQNLSPILDEIAKDRKNIKVIKIDVGGNKETKEPTNPRTQEKYDIHSFPTLCLFRDGKVVDVRLGGGAEFELKHWIDEALKQDPSSDMDHDQYLKKAEEEKTAANRQMNKAIIPILTGIALWKLAKGATGLTLAIAGIATSDPGLIGLGTVTTGFAAVDIHDSMVLKEEKKILPRLPENLQTAYKLSEGATHLTNSNVLHNMTNGAHSAYSSAALHGLSFIELSEGFLKSAAGLRSLFSKKSKPGETTATQKPEKDEQVICKDGVCHIKPPENNQP